MISPEPGFEKINKLVLVGNGFDLAHGLRSSYKDFFNHYLKSIFQNLNQHGFHQDTLIQLRFTDIHQAPIVSNFREAEVLQELILSRKIQTLGLDQLFTKILVNFQKNGWADIEIEYFDTISSFGNSFDTIKEVNEQMEFFKRELLSYLREEENNNFEFCFSQDLFEQMTQRIKLEECKLGLELLNEEAHHYYFVNFNYTDILKKYLDKFSQTEASLNHIHGTMNPSNNNNQNPIFGFGDESDHKLREYEIGRSKEPFVHVKSFKYLEGDNYRNLMSFVNSQSFQVLIFGHSCGISDKTLLSTIFEHENCISIKSYYYEKDESNDFTDRNYAISRLFKDKSELRSKVVNFTLCEPMVQPL